MNIYCELLKITIIIIIMREIRNRKPGGSVKFPIIKDKPQQPTSFTATKGLKLQKIGHKKNLMILDIANINKI